MSTDSTRIDPVRIDSAAIDPALRARLAAWLRQLDDDMLAGWANRGLLRRARGVLAAAGDVDAAWTADGLRCAIDGQTQTLDGPGFQHLRCGCPAAGACHHALAALLHWAAQSAAAPEAAADTGSDDAAPPFWSQPDWVPLARALGAAALRRAAAWLEDDVTVLFAAAGTRLDAQVQSAVEARLRFDAALGPDAAACTCAQTRCAHRALALLVWRRQQGLDTGTPLASPRPRSERVVLDAVREALLALAAEGQAQLSTTRIDDLTALAQRCRQAELPLLSHALRTLQQALAEEFARRGRARPETAARLLAHAWARLRALEANPAPQPRAQLTGRHRRDYRPAPPLDLQIVALERWDLGRGEADRAGFSLHAWCLDTGRWWRLPVADYAGLDGDRPDWRSHTWAGRALPALLGRRRRLIGAWASADGSLTARTDTRWDDDPTPDPTPDDASPTGTIDTIAADTTVAVTDIRTPPDPAVAQDIVAAAQRWRAARPGNVLDARPQIVLLGPLRLQPPVAAAGLDWSQTGHDAHGDGRSVELRLNGDSDSRQRAIARLQAAQTRQPQISHALGWLQCIDGRVLLEPLSLWDARAQAWLHLHAPDLALPAPEPQEPGPAEFTSESLSESPPEPPPRAPDRDDAPPRALLHNLLRTRDLLCRRLASGGLQEDPGFTLAARAWREHAIGRHWPALLHGLDDPDTTPARRSEALLDALLRVELAIQSHGADLAT